MFGILDSVYFYILFRIYFEYFSCDVLLFTNR